MVLVDTSVWIDFITETDTPRVAAFNKVIESGTPFGLTAVVYQELLQGASSRKDFEKLDRYLRSQRFYRTKEGLDTYSAAAQLYFRCRRRGTTIRSTIDCLIAQTAIDNEVLLLHDDRDYVEMARHIPELRLFETWQESLP